MDPISGTTVTLRARHAAVERFGARYADVVEVEHAMPSGTTATYWFARGKGLIGVQTRDPDSEVRLVAATVAGQAVIGPSGR